MTPTLAITLKPIWAWAILNADKRIENRTWYTKHRGPLYIHAGCARVTPDDRQSLARRLASVGLAYPDETTFPRGGLVAVVTLADCVRLPTPRLGAWGAPGCWHWLLADVSPLDVPIPMSGKLSLWRVERPA